MAAVTSRGLQIQKKQRLFPWFLLATLLPILVMPFSNLEGNAAQRLILPLAAYAQTKNISTAISAASTKLSKSVVNLEADDLNKT